MKKDIDVYLSEKRVWFVFSAAPIATPPSGPSELSHRLDTQAMVNAQPHRHSSHYHHISRIAYSSVVKVWLVFSAAPIATPPSGPSEFQPRLDTHAMVNEKPDRHSGHHHHISCIAYSSVVKVWFVSSAAPIATPSSGPSELLYKLDTHAMVNEQPDRHSSHHHHISPIAYSSVVKVWFVFSAAPITTPPSGPSLLSPRLDKQAMVNV
jgi:hypothetical protein